MSMCAAPPRGLHVTASRPLPATAAGRLPPACALNGTALAGGFILAAA